MQLTDSQKAFLEKNHAGAMITLHPDGSPHAVRVGVALVDGKVWSSGTPDRVRTAHVRRDPRCAFIVWDHAWGSLTMEGRVTILDGPEAPDLSVELFRTMQKGMDPGPRPGHLMWQGVERTEEEFRRLMVEERRLVYQLEVERAYGLSA